MANTIKALYWLYKSKMNKEGAAPLMIRLSFQGQRRDKSTGFYIQPNQWNPVKQKVKGSDQRAMEINDWMKAFTAKVISICRESSEINLPSIIDKLFAKPKQEPFLIELMQEHNKRIKARVGKDYSFSTYEKYMFTLNKIQAFISARYHKKDILLKDLNPEFIMDFDHYMKVKDHNQHNTSVKYCLNLKKVINEAILMGLLKTNPFHGFKTVYRDTPQIYLQESEVVLLQNLRLVKPYHLLVRDLFLFQCYTGLAYTDMTALTSNDFTIDQQGRTWIIKVRQKTGITSYIPMLPKAQEIITKYQEVTNKKASLLPFYSIQKYNKYLGEIGELAGFSKKLSSHVGRRTFGNIALGRGISINVISKILGHSNILITQRIYAITTQNIVSAEIAKW